MPIRTSLALVVLLAPLTNVRAQELVPDKALEIELKASDAVLEGHGPSRTFEYDVSFDGMLHVWAASKDFDPILRITDSDGELLAEDDNSGGGTTAYVALVVTRNELPSITVASEAPAGAGALVLHVSEAPETDATRAEAELGFRELVAIETLGANKELTAARTRVGALVEHLLAIEGAGRSSALVALAWRAGLASESLALVEPRAKAYGLVLAERERTLPGDHFDLQSVRANVALVLAEQGDLHGALALQQQTLDVLERVLPADDFDLQRTRLSVASTLRRLGDSSRALLLARQALEVLLRTRSDADDELQRARRVVANVLKDTGDLRGARALEEKTLEVCERVLPQDHPDLQRARLSLASTLAVQGELSRARELQEKVLEVRTRTLPAEHPDVQNARANLASTLSLLGDLPRARELHEQVLEYLARTLPDEHVELQTARHNLAGTLAQLGDLPRARALEEHVLEVYERTLSPEHVRVQRARQNLASTLRLLGDRARSRALEEQVLVIWSRTLPDDDPDLQLARANLASTLESLGDLQGARTLGEKVVEIEARTRAEGDPRLQIARINLAVTLKRLGDLRGARALEEQVVASFSQGPFPDHPELRRARGNLAVTLRELGDLEGARALQESVLESCARTLPDTHRDLQLARFSLARTLAETARSAPSEGRERERARFVELSRSYVRGAREAALASVLEGSGREAEERAESGDVLSLALSLYDGFEVFAADPALADEVFLLSECTRDIGLVSARLARAARADPSWGTLSEELRLETRALADLGRRGVAGDEFRLKRAERERTERELVQLGSGLDPGALARWGATRAAIEASLAPQDALVSYRRYARSELAERGAMHNEDHLCAFVVRAETGLALVDLGPIEPLVRAVESWRSALGAGASAMPSRGVGAAPAATGDALARAEDIRRIAFDPLAPALEGVTRVAVALDDALHLVPFDALPAKEATNEAAPRALLGDVLQIEIRPSLLEALGERAPDASADALLVIGNVDYDREQGAAGPDVAAPDSQRALDRAHSVGEPRFSALASTGEEARGIATLWRERSREQARAELLEGALASRSALGARTPNARWLHVGTHGWFAPESMTSAQEDGPLDLKLDFGTRMSVADEVRSTSAMLLCGLALAGANLPADATGRVPGLLTAEELATLDLSNCELAVLSACDTNVGVRCAGQGVASLQKALHMAGARSVITSLWKVPDEATKELMLDFYRRMWVEKKPKAQALWEAKLKLRNA